MKWIKELLLVFFLCQLSVTVGSSVGVVGGSSVPNEVRMDLAWSIDLAKRYVVEIRVTTCRFTTLLFARGILD
jgi:hypothetical protein